MRLADALPQQRSLRPAADARVCEAAAEPDARADDGLGGRPAGVSGSEGGAVWVAEVVVHLQAG